MTRKRFLTNKLRTPRFFCRSRKNLKTSWEGFDRMNCSKQFKYFSTESYQLNSFLPDVPYWSHWKHQKTFQKTFLVFLMFSRGSKGILRKKWPKSQNWDYHSRYTPSLVSLQAQHVYSTWNTCGVFLRLPIKFWEYLPSRIIKVSDSTTKPKFSRTSKNILMKYFFLQTLFKLS